MRQMEVSLMGSWQDVKGLQYFPLSTKEDLLSGPVTERA